MSNNRITPFVKRMRTNGGTIYTFSSAVEDIGLNINERNNVVKISHFALLDIPSINEPTTLDENRFNVQSIAGAWEYEQDSASVKDGRVLIAESFQNYALNLENNLLNSSSYDPTLIRTVTERVFWKWMKETGAVRFDKDVSTASKQYWSEEIDADGSLGYNSVVKYVGPVSAGNVRTDSFGTYNETYVLVPTSHGQTDAYFEIIDDENYKHGMEIGDLGEKILGRESYTLPHPDGLSYNAYYDFVDSSTQVGDTPYYTYFDNSTGAYTSGWWYTAEGVEPASTDNAYLTDSSIYLTSGIYNTDLKYDGGGDVIEFKRSKVDCLSMVLDLDELKDIYSDSTLTYDKMAIQYAINDNFNFNAVLIYYSVMNSTEEDVLGRNLLGVLFIDAPEGNSSAIGFDGITIPSLEKIMSGPGGFGTSYSLRLNIKTDNMVDDTTATIVDQATSDQLYAEDWTEAFENLNIAVNILSQNNSTLNYISGQYIEVQSTQTQILNDLEALQWQVNDISRDINGVPNNIAMFADGDDPLIESSIYMRFGNVGIQTDEPGYPLHVVGTTKVDEIIIENAIKDTSGNILLGYGSPQQLGSSTNYRDLDIYTGGNDPVVHIDTSSHIIMDADASILGDFQVAGVTVFNDLVVMDGSILSPNFDFEAEYLQPVNVGAGLQWDGTHFNAVVTGVNQLWEMQDTSVGDSSTYDMAFDGSLLMLAAADGKWTYTSAVTGGGGTGDVAWANGNLGSNNQVLTAGGDGSIHGEPGLVWDGATLDVSGNLEFGNDANRSITIAGGPTPRNLTIDPQNGGNLYLKGGAATGGGNSYLDGGAGAVAGNVYIGTINSNRTYMNPSRMQTGTPGSNEVLYITGAGASSEVRRGTIAVAAVTSYTNSGSNRIITSLGGTGITAETNLEFTGNTMITFGTAPLIITTDDTGTVSGALTLKTGGSSSGSGDVNITSGAGGGGAAGDINIYAGNGTAASSVNITGGSLTGPPIPGGHVVIKGGVGSGGSGNITIGTTQTAKIFMGNSVTIPSGTPASSEMLFIDTGSSNQIKRGTVPVAAGGTGRTSVLANYMLTGNGSSAMTAEANLRFSGTSLSLYSGSNEEIRITNAGAIDADGDITAYSTLIPSDIRLKENILPLTNSLDKILKLDGISYDKKSDGEHHIGLIAQATEKVIPEVVIEAELPLLKNREADLYKTINYTEIIPYLIEGMKEQQKMIEDLKNEVEILKNK